MQVKTGSTAEISRALDSVPLMLWLSGKDKSFEFFNDGWVQFTGRFISELTGDGWLESVHADDLPGFVSLYNASFDDNKEFQLQIRIKDKDGAYSWFAGSAAPRFDEDGAFLGYAGGFTRMSPGEAVAKLEASLAGQTLALQKLTDKLTEKNLEQERNNAELESFTYIASHDLQEPLRKIQSFSKLIMAKDSANFSDSAKDYFSRILTAAERMQRLIDDLLSYSGTNVSEVSFVATDLNAVLKDVLQNFQEFIEEKQAVIEAAELPVIRVIPFQINQLFTNIIANALKFSKADGPIKIKINAVLVTEKNIQSTEEVKPNSYWNISFTDNGIGFEQQYESRIFELFQRLHGKNEYIGTGIGLAICKKIAHNHNGYITAIGKPGEGSVFNIYLPAN